MGKHQVGRIRALESASRNLWQRHCAGDDSVFDDVFAALCRRYDGLDWDTDLLQVAIETEIAEEAEISIQTIRVVLDAELAGRELVTRNDDSSAHWSCSRLVVFVLMTATL